MKITAHKTNGKNHFSLYTSTRLSGKNKAFVQTMRVKASSKEEALSEENITRFLKNMVNLST